MDLGAKSGVSIGDRKSEKPWAMEPLKNGDTIRLGVSTRTYTFKVNLNAQIEALERQQRELMAEAQAIDADAANPVEAAKRAQKDAAWRQCSAARSRCTRGGTTTTGRRSASRAAS